MKLRLVRSACLVLTLFVSVGVVEADAQNLNRIFGHTEGAFVLYDLKSKQYVRHNETRCRRRFTPASTFKIPNSLIGLETDVVRDADFIIPWDRQRYPNEGRPNSSPFIHWWQDQTLRSAMKYSVVWYYIEIARRVGAQRMQKHVTQFRYGNADTSGGIEHFWLEREGNVYFFALNMDGKNYEAIRDERINLTKRILRR